jgi:hypothetical protein
VHVVPEAEFATQFPASPLVMTGTVEQEVAVQVPVVVHEAELQVAERVPA